MSKQRRTTSPPQGTPPTRAPRYGASRGNGQGPALLTLAGVMVLLMISFANWREIDGIEESLEGRLGQLDTRMAQLADKVDKLPAQAAQAAKPRRRGPDPDKVYTIKTAGAPSKGPANAPVTIAEFSDFQ